MKFALFRNSVMP